MGNIYNFPGRGNGRTIFFSVIIVFIIIYQVLLLLILIVRLLPVDDQRYF